MSGHALAQKRFINLRVFADLTVAEKLKENTEQKGIIDTFFNFLFKILVMTKLDFTSVIRAEKL